MSVFLPEDRSHQQLLDELAAIAERPLTQATALPPGLYTHEAIAELEQQHIFSQQWLCAGRADSIPNTNDYLTYHIGVQPIVVIRQADGELQAFANICRHRMMQLLDGRGECENGRITCPYHAWSYGIDGTLLGAPQMKRTGGFEAANLSLTKVRCEVWQGWIYVTLNDAGESVAKQLEGLDELTAHYEMSHYVHVVQQDHLWDTNWKLLTENFMEGYHLPVAHKNTVGADFPIHRTQFSSSNADDAFTYQTFMKTSAAPVGNAHSSNSRLKDEQRRTSIMPTVFPSHMYVLAPDHLWYLSLQPKGVGQVHIRYGAALAPEVVENEADPDAYIREFIEFLDEVNEEDRFVVEGIYSGAKAPLSKPGPLCWLEQSIHEFAQYLSRRLCAESHP